tara:strand:- start:612 stop:1028 length:417 start_codon:yes stop_codon:yes gene_type:complete
MSDVDKLIVEASKLADQAAQLSDNAVDLSQRLINTPFIKQQTIVEGVDPFIFAITVFILACFVGYYVVWKVTPALHTPLMSVTNAVSSIVIVGAMLATASTVQLSSTLGLVAILLVSINIFGGFIVTQRMLHMFKKKR